MTTSLKVVGHRLLIKPIKVVDELQKDLPEELAKLGFEVKVGDKRTQLMYQAGVERGSVVGIGPMAWKDPALGYGTTDWQPWAEIGDEVLFVKYSGKPAVDPDTDEEFLVMNDVDMIAVVGKAA